MAKLVVQCTYSNSILHENSWELRTERNFLKVLVRGPRQNIPKDIDRPRASLLVKHMSFLVRKTFEMRSRVGEGYNRNKTNGKSSAAYGEKWKKCM